MATQVGRAFILTEFRFDTGQLQRDVQRQATRTGQQMGQQVSQQATQTLTQRLGAGAVGIGRTLGTGIANAASTAVRSGASAVSAAFDGISGVLRPVTSRIGNLAGAAMATGAGQALQRGAGVVASAFSAVQGMAAPVLTRVGTAVGGFLTNTVGGAVRAGAGAIGAAFQGVAGHVASALSGLRGLGAHLLQIGQQWGATLISGLQSALGRVGQIAGQVSQALQGFVPVGAAAAGFGYLAFQMSQAAVKSGQLDQAIRLLSGQLGVSSDEVEKQINALKRMNASHQTAQKFLIGMLDARLDVTKATELYAAAEGLAVTRGMEGAQVAESLIHGIRTQNIEVLRQVGIQLDTNTVLDDYAKKNNKSREALTGAERAQAFLNATMEQATPYIATATKAMEENQNAAKPYNWVALKAALSDFQLALGTAFEPVFSAIGRGIAFILPKFIQLVNALGPAKPYVAAFALGLAGLAIGLGITAVAAGALSAALTPVTIKLIAIAAIVALALAPLIALGLGLKLAYDRCEPFRAAVDAVGAALAWMGQQVGAGIVVALAWFRDRLAEVAGRIGELWVRLEPVRAAIAQLWLQIQPLLAQLHAWIVQSGVLEAALKILGIALVVIVVGPIALLIAALGMIVATAMGMALAIAWVVGHVVSLFQWMGVTSAAIWAVLSTWIGARLADIGSAVSSTTSFLQSVWGAATGWLYANTVERLMGVYNTLAYWMGMAHLKVAEIMGGIQMTAQNAWNAVGEHFRNGIRGVVDIVNKFVGGLNKLPGLGDLQPITVEGLYRGGTIAAGGIASQPMIALAENRRDEYVIPTEERYRGRAHALWAAVGQRLNFFQGGGIVSPWWHGSWPQTQGFGRTGFSGAYASGAHSGIDIGMPNNTPIVAAVKGVAQAVSDSSGYGTYVKFYPSEAPGIEIILAHLASHGTMGAVEAGTQIGLSDNSGFSTGAHLHFEVRSGGSAIDPTEWMKSGTGPAGGGGGGFNPLAIIEALKNEALKALEGIPEFIRGFGRWVVENLAKGALEKIPKDIHSGFSGLVSGLTGALSREQLIDVLRKAGWPEHLFEWCLKIIQRESGGKADIIGPAWNGDGGSIGLFQVQPGAWPQFDRNKLKDALYNAQAAWHIYNAQGPNAWSTNYDTGGEWPAHSWGYNGRSDSEFVFTRNQLANLALNLAHAPLGGGGGGRGPALEIHEAHFHDEADLTSLMRKTEFALASGRL